MLHIAKLHPAKIGGSTGKFAFNGHCGAGVQVPSCRMAGLEPVSYTHLDVYKRQYQQRGLELYAFQDTAAAMQNMLLCAADLGFAACWVGAFDEEACRRVLDLPAHLRPVAMLPVGYPAADAPLTDAVMPKRAPLEKILDFV